MTMEIQKEEFQLLRVTSHNNYEEKLIQMAFIKIIKYFKLFNNLKGITVLLLSGPPP